jgi:hypothetical protein
MKGDLLAQLLALELLQPWRFERRPLTPQLWEYYPGFKRP